MSDNDKTKQKFMESMRMTKTESGNKPNIAADAQKETAVKTSKPAVRSKRAAAPKKVVKEPQKSVVSHYFETKRVWPD